MKKYQKPNRYVLNKFRKNLKVSVGEFAALMQVLRPHLENLAIRRAAHQPCEESKGKNL